MTTALPAAAAPQPRHSLTTASGLVAILRIDETGPWPDVLECQRFLSCNPASQSFFILRQPRERGSI